MLTSQRNTMCPLQVKLPCLLVVSVHTVLSRLYLLYLTSTPDNPNPLPYNILLPCHFLLPCGWIFTVAGGPSATAAAVGFADDLRLRRLVPLTRSRCSLVCGWLLRPLVFRRDAFCCCSLRWTLSCLPSAPSRMVADSSFHVTRRIGGNRPVSGAGVEG